MNKFRTLIFGFIQRKYSQNSRLEGKYSWRRKCAVGGSVSMCMFAGYRYTQIQSLQFDDRITPVKLTLYSLLPLRLLSRAWGLISDTTVPLSLRTSVYTTFSKFFNLNLQECEYDLEEYRSLSEFFVRGLKEECRPIDKSQNSVVSPADGTIVSLGEIKGEYINQVKGSTYRIDRFLGKPTWLQSQDDSSDNYVNNLKYDTNNRLYQVVIYLSPGDCHRFHSPASCRFTFRRHFWGFLLSVNPSIAATLSELFDVNERVVYVGKWKFGFFSMTPVGATNVGSICVDFDKSLSTNCVTLKHKDCIEKLDVSIDKGDYFGMFKFGSTIVLIFEAPKNFKFTKSVGAHVKYGEQVGIVS